MKRQVYINLPVKDLHRSMDFFRSLGFSFNDQFSDEKAACLIISEGAVYSMLLSEPFFKTFTKKEISDAKNQTEVLIAIEASSREEVDEMISKALAAGGKLYREPQDHGWMYERSFEDLDGHQWEIMYMDESKLPQQENQDHDKRTMAEPAG